MQEGQTCRKSGVFKKLHDLQREGTMLPEEKISSRCMEEKMCGLREAPRVRGRVCKNEIESGHRKTKSGALTACIGKKSARRLDIHDMRVGEWIYTI